MTKLPALSGALVVRALERAGFEVPCSSDVKKPGVSHLLKFFWDIILAAQGQTACTLDAMAQRR